MANEHLLFNAVSSLRIDDLCKLLESKDQDFNLDFNINNQSLLNFAINKYRSCTSQGDKETAKAIVKKIIDTAGANTLSIKDNSGKSPLETAAELDLADVASMIIKKFNDEYNHYYANFFHGCITNKMYKMAAKVLCGVYTHNEIKISPEVITPEIIKILEGAGFSKEIHVYLQYLCSINSSAATKAAEIIVKTCDVSLVLKSINTNLGNLKPLDYALKFKNYSVASVILDRLKSSTQDLIRIENQEVRKEQSSWEEKNKFMFEYCKGKPLPQAIYYDNGSTPITKQTNAIKQSKATSISIDNTDTLDQAIYLINSGAKNVAVLDMAHSRSTGGGFRTCKGTQEEDIVRNCNLLYGIEPSLNPDFVKEMENKTNIKNPRYKVPKYGCIYVKGVGIFRKSDGDFLEKNMNVDVIVSAANNPFEKLKTRVKSWDELYKDVTIKIRSMLRAAVLNNAKNLVLGAYGCGGFKMDDYLGDPAKYNSTSPITQHLLNNPSNPNKTSLVVAKAFKEVLAEPEFSNAFEHISFAILGSTEGVIYQNFAKEFSQNKNLNKIKLKL